MYSGPVAAHGYSRLASDGLPETFVILGPNHTGYGSGVSIMTEGNWETPLGQVPIDETLAKKIQKATTIIDIDEEAHAFEHSIEVQLPFIQFLYGNAAKFVPVCMMMQDLQTSREVARAIVQQAKERDIFIVASSDFTHYERQEVANAKDATAIDEILHLDEGGLNALGETSKVTMCGYGPITVLMASANLLGFKPELLTHKTSGDVTGDKNAVVGYTSLIMNRD
jgi:AmmeMemoRadiSam system protein B